MLKKFGKNPNQNPGAKKRSVGIFLRSCFVYVAVIRLTKFQRILLVPNTDSVEPSFPLAPHLTAACQVSPISVGSRPFVASFGNDRPGEFSRIFPFSDWWNFSIYDAIQRPPSILRTFSKGRRQSVIELLGSSAFRWSLCRS